MAAIIKQKRPKVKLALHPRNKHRERYDLKLLAEINPALDAFILTNKFDDDSIDFANPEAVKALNTALIKQYYGITYWDIPEGYLCPAIPGRADYLHYLADLLASAYSAMALSWVHMPEFPVRDRARAVADLLGETLAPRESGATS